MRSVLSFDFARFGVGPALVVFGLEAGVVVDGAAVVVVADVPVAAVLVAAAPVGYIHHSTAADLVADLVPGAAGCTAACPAEPLGAPEGPTHATPDTLHHSTSADLAADPVLGTAESPAGCPAGSVGAPENLLRATPDPWPVGMHLGLPQEWSQAVADVVAVGLADSLVHHHAEVALGPVSGLGAPAVVPPPKLPVSPASGLGAPAAVPPPKPPVRPVSGRYP